MARNKLILNRDKTKLLVIGFKHWPCPYLYSILVGNCHVHLLNMARKIGADFEQTLSLDVNLVSKSAVFQLRNKVCYN